VTGRGDRRPARDPVSAGIRVLIVYSRVGGGHVSVARALEEALLAARPAGAERRSGGAADPPTRGGGVSVELVDAYLACGRPPVTWFPALYAELTRKHGHLWAAFYRATQRAAARLDGDRLLGPFLLPGFERVLAERAPDVVVSVLPGVNGLLAAAGRRHGRPRLEVVLTDWYDVHPVWVGRGVDRYITPTDAARLDCVRHGAAPERVDVVGFPVRSAFAAPPARADARAWLAAAHGLDPRRFTIVVMMGAEGSPHALANVRALLGLDLDAQLVVVCGRDARLRRRLAALQGCSGQGPQAGERVRGARLGPRARPGRVELRALGFVAEVPSLMRAADVLVTKAGGVSLAEAFCCAVPVVIADPLAGQEAGNLTYALQRGAVAAARSPAALARLVEALARSPDRRAALAARGAALARPHAAACIARRLLEPG
jgi:1,2-diacylglycerol 3-beta-galactosyltransferase